MRKQAFAILFSISSFSFLTGFGDKYSTVETKATPEGSSLVVQFLVKPNSGMKLTKEGPWSVTLTNLDGLSLPLTDGKFVTKDFDEKLPGFTLKSTLDPKIKEAKADYHIKAFVCTEDKKHCYPQQHKGVFSWKKAH